MKVYFTNKHLGWLIVLLISFPIFYFPWKGVIEGNQPFLYKPVPYKAAELKTYNAEYRFASATQGQRTVGWIRGAQAIAAFGTLFVALLDMALKLISNKRGKYTFRVGANLNPLSKDISDSG